MAKSKRNIVVLLLEAVVFTLIFVTLFYQCS